VFVSSCACVRERVWCEKDRLRERERERERERGRLSSFVSFAERRISQAAETHVTLGEIMLRCAIDVECRIEFSLFKLYHARREKRCDSALLNFDFVKRE
jgi:hypothetical protein